MSTRSRSSGELSLTTEIQSNFSGWAGKMERGVFGSFSVLTESMNAAATPLSPVVIYMQVLALFIDAL